MERNQIKTLLECCTSFEAADGILKKYVSFDTLEEYIAYLKGMFDVSIFHKAGGSVYDDYVCLLTSIIKSKSIS